MLFKPEMCEQILRGRKTQTRRIVKEGDWVPLFVDADAIGVLTKRGRSKWKVGNTYAVQSGRGKKSLGRIRLLSIRRERLQQITEEDAQAEGAEKIASYKACDHPPFGSIAATYRQGFQFLWDFINTKKGTRWRDGPDVWVLEFELGEGVSD